MKANNKVASFLLALACLDVKPSPGLDYPGMAPGTIAAFSRVGEIGLSNQTIAAAWKIDKGLKFERLQDAEAGQTLEFTGEAFAIVVTNTIYRASGLVPESRPRIKALLSKPYAARLAEQVPGRALELYFRSTDGRLGIVWRAVGRENANYLRQEIELTALRDDCFISEIKWLEEAIPGARTEGLVDGSPVVAGKLFFGCEDPHALNLANPEARSASGERNVSCLARPNITLRRGERLESSFVTGVTPIGQLRRGFLYYLERERAHPYRPFLHYNSWYDIAWDPFALNETNCLDAIQLFGERLIRAHNVVLDSMVFDDGWDDPQSLWQFHDGFPHGFSPLAKLCKRYDTHLGVWLSPFGGYGESRRQRLEVGAAKGYETNATGFSLAGPKYYAAFKRTCKTMVRKYGVNHFKFDGIAAGMYANGSADYYRDTQAMLRLMRELRQVNPDVYINLTTGSWPSPFWLRYADSIWRQGDDMGFTGRGGRQQQWLTYRDREVYRNIVRKAPLFPLNSLMTQGVAYSRRGPAGDPTFDSAGFKDDVMAFFGSGTGLQELYIQPDKLTAKDWEVLALAARWSRANADVLLDTHWIGGDPGLGEVYGYASWNSRLSIIMLRNPQDQPQEFSLDIGQVLDLPRGAPTSFVLKSPWPIERSASQAIHVKAGIPQTIQLLAFGIQILEAAPES